MAQRRTRAAPTRKASGRYRVANPRNIPKGRNIYTAPSGKKYKEGDTIDISGDNDDLDRLVKRGFIVRE